MHPKVFPSEHSFSFNIFPFFLYFSPMPSAVVQGVHSVSNYLQRGGLRWASTSFPGASFYKHLMQCLFLKILLSIILKNADCCWIPDYTRWPTLQCLCQADLPLLGACNELGTSHYLTKWYARVAWCALNHVPSVYPSVCESGYSKNCASTARNINHVGIKTPFTSLNHSLKIFMSTK